MPSDLSAGPTPPPAAIVELLERFREGKRIALARAISVVEDERPGFQSLLHEVVAQGLRAERVGITGPPGAGKSTLVAALATAYRKQDLRVGVCAVDPTSPYSGGALLGDRIRMTDVSTDPGIFIRSMATRGSLGGLATTTKEVIDLMDAFGFPKLIVETVGVGQTELEITGAADTVVVVLVPESGDGVQALKAGLMEIADIFVVNKADRPGADRLIQEISLAVHLRGGDPKAVRASAGHHGVDLGAASSAADAPDGEKKPRRYEKLEPEEMEAWEIPVVRTVAQTGEGVEELLEQIDRHRRFLEAGGELGRRRRARAETRVRDVVERELRRIAWAAEGRRAALRSGLDAITAGDETPYSVATRIVRGMLKSDDGDDGE